LRATLDDVRAHHAKAIIASDFFVGVTATFQLRCLLNLFFRSLDSGAVPPTENAVWQKTGAGPIHGDGQGLLGQCATATVAILGTLAM
jgi:hypothetical protein